MHRRQNRITQLSGDGSERSLSQGSSRSKCPQPSFLQSADHDSIEDLSKASTPSGLEAASNWGVFLPEVNDGEFRVRIIGCIENVYGLGSGPLDVINLIDVAQQENELPLSVNEDAIITLTVHGIKLTKYGSNAVIYRIPIHLIERLVIYDDGLIGNTMLAVKCVRDQNKDYSDGPYDIHAYQCGNKEIAQEVCNRFNHILETAVSTTSPTKS